MQTVGVIGGGQLARMMISAAHELGVPLQVYADAEGSASELAATAIGDPADVDRVLDFAAGVDVITFDHEQVPQQTLAALAAAGVPTEPKAEALQFAQNKLLMRNALEELGLPQPAWAAVYSVADVDDFIAANGGKAVVKTPTGGYDGHGVRFVTSGTEVADWFVAGEPLLAEAMVEFKRELSQMLARNASGEIKPWVVVETIQRNGVCNEALAPAPQIGSEQAELARRIGVSIADGLDVTGVFAVEMFETTAGEILVNELAMRPHNSGHWSMDGAVTGQFEQHIRAVLNMPLGDPTMRDAHAVMVNVLGGPTDETFDTALADTMREYPELKIHWYGKSYRPGRKVGHINGFGADATGLIEHARAAAKLLKTDSMY